MTTPPTVCLGFRNWHVDHLHRCITRLATSGWPIVFVDYGSEPALAAALARTLHDYPTVHTVLVPPQAAPEWSRAAALNRAAEAAPNATTLVFTDADMLFPREWFEVCEAMLDAAEGRETLWLTDSRDLPRLGAQAPEDWWVRDPWLRAASVEHDRVGQGAAMVVPGAWFRAVGGFDEVYRVWGAEDNDLVLRARWAGLTVDWLPGAWVAHQWHSRNWATPAQLQQVQRNRDYLAHRIAERGPVIRNQPPVPTEA